MSWQKLVVSVLVGIVAGGAVSGCELPEATPLGVPGGGAAVDGEAPGPGASEGAGEEVAASDVPGPREVRRATRRLAGLSVTDRPRGTGDYRRDAFGSAWADTDGNGCNQRDDVLLRDAVPGSTTLGRQGRCEHDVLAGTFVDPYSGRTHVLDDLKNLSQAQAVQIDHVVPLAEAWVSGASTWTPERRREFANDLGVLLAVDGATNGSKGAGDPAAWRPRKGYQCTYAVRWITVKHRWQLQADAPEVRALEEMLAFC